MLKAVIIAVIGLPVMAGLAGAVLPALGFFPPLGGTAFGVEAMTLMLAEAGLWRSLRLTLLTGVLATLIATVMALILPAVFFGTARFSWLRRYLAPVLSLPHVTVAVGILFLLQPSGWLMRLLSPALTGFDRPPTFALVPDDHGLALVLGLVAKEIPFLVLMVLAALGQIDAARLMLVVRSLGYGRLRGWVMVIIPQLWPLMRLPVIIVLVFSLSVIDMAVVLAPGTPAPLAVRILDWYQDPDLQRRFVASAAAVLQCLICLGAIGVMLGLEGLARVLGGMVARGGQRHPGFRALAGPLITPLVSAAGMLPFLLAVMGMVSALIWSVAAIWRFPESLPRALTGRYWMALSGDLGIITLQSLFLGLVSSGLAVLLAVIWLEYRRPPGRLFERLIFLPLVVPQIGFLFGLQVVLLWLGVDGLVLAIIWAHLLFVFPYVWLALAPAWRAFPEPTLILAASLGQSRWQRLFRVRLPMLLTPILTAFAVGFSVSSALYLPTIFAGNAKVITLTVEAVTLATGAGRQPLGVATGLQMILPLGVFLSVAAISRWRFRGLRGIS
ncbi:MAG: ABC transporter permease [Candidatus Puniceispirillales bacterium]